MSRPHSDLIFALVGDVRLSSRALRQLRWLAAEGITVEALSFDEVGDRAVAENVRLTTLDRPNGSGPHFFWRVHRLFRAAAMERPARAYHASDLYTLPALAAAAREHGAQLAYDSRELYPHVDATAGRPWARLTWSAIERRYIHRCDVVFTVNESISSRLREVYGIADPVVVRNLTLPPRITGSDVLRRRLGIAPDQPIVLYQGLFHRGRGLEGLIAAVAGVAGAHLVLIGDGPIRSELMVQAVASLQGRAHFLPFVPPDELPPLTASADVGVHVPEPITESVRLALPNKLFEYLAAGLPVIVSDLPEMAAVVVKYDVGLVVPPGDVARLTEALRKSLGDDTSRGRWRSNIPRVFEVLDPERERQGFVQAYMQLLD